MIKNSIISKIKNILIICSLLAKATNLSSNPDLIININNEDNKASNCNVLLRFENNGRIFEARTITNNDTEYYQLLFAHELIMSKFGSGYPKDKETTKKRVAEHVKRQNTGIIDSFFTIFEIKKDKTEERVGNFVLGGGEFAIALAEESFLRNPLAKKEDKPTIMNQGLGKKITAMLTKVIMPEYIKIYQNNQSNPIIEKVFSFVKMGIAATSNIDNIPSNLMLSSFFESKQTNQELFSELFKNNENKEKITNLLASLGLYEDKTSFNTKNKEDLINSSINMEQAYNQLQKKPTELFETNVLDKNFKYSCYLILKQNLMKITIGYSPYGCAKLYWKKTYDSYLKEGNIIQPNS